MADPFAGLVSRALGRPIDAVEVERVAREEEVAGAETDRVRWHAAGAAGSLLFRRYPTKATTEPGLLPLLSRRGAPVPEIFASGVPPRHAAEARPWLLMGDPGAALARHDDALAALEATRVAVKRDLTTIVSLGVPELSPTRIRDEALWAEELLEAGDFTRVRRMAAELDVVRVSTRGTSLVHGVDTKSGIARLPRASLAKITPWVMK